VLYRKVEIQRCSYYTLRRFFLSIRRYFDSPVCGGMHYNGAVTAGGSVPLTSGKKPEIISDFSSECL